MRDLRSLRRADPVVLTRRVYVWTAHDEFGRLIGEQMLQEEPATSSEFLRRRQTQGERVRLNDYLYFVHQAEELYTYLSPSDALKTFPKGSIAAFLITLGMYSGRYLVLIKSALADQPTFLPPFGLPQSVFTVVILGFILLFFVLVLGLFYAGFLAKKKSQPAANAVSHLVTFLSGTLLGIRMN
jgi:hypothetical protein